jgi:GNAT superfamily N-acetyltransferase
MAEPLRIRERPRQAGVVALLEAEGLPASDLTEGLELYGHDALLRSLAVGAAARTQGLGSALVLHAEKYAAAHHKYWVTDPTGIAWETFRTLGRIPVYGEDTAVFNHGESTKPVEAPIAGCCAPAQRAEPASCCAK